MTDSAGPQDSPVPGVTPFISHFESAPVSARARRKPSRVPGSVLESSGSRLGRRVRRVRLYAVAFIALALLVYVVALAGLNTHRVRVDWVFGRSSVALVWLVMLAAIPGWLLGLIFAAAFHWRTRAPRRP